jgi:hypothetical protein
MYDYNTVVTCDFSLADPADGTMVSGNTYEVDFLAAHLTYTSWCSGWVMRLVDLTASTTLETVTVPGYTVANKDQWISMSLPAYTYTGPAGHKLGLTVDATQLNGMAHIDQVQLLVTAVPEPSALSLLGLFGGAFLLRLRRRNK